MLVDHLLIKPDTTPNRKVRLAFYPALPAQISDALPADTDVVLVWGEGFDSALAPSGAKVRGPTMAMSTPVVLRLSVLSPAKSASRNNANPVSYTQLTPPTIFRG